MTQNSLPSSSEKAKLGGTYTANVLGTIRSHLEALQGYDVMALELIQNADDAGAREISFDVTDEALVVSNSATFSYCGDLKQSPCQKVLSADGVPKQCDFHSIIEVASGGKLEDSENIGRFGIGFISTYQITDSPEIRSLDLALRLHPELSEWSGQETEPLEGTRLTFPWARNGETRVRVLLQLSAITDHHIGGVLESTKMVIERSLLFLNHVSTVQLKRNGTQVYSAKIDRTAFPKISISFDSGGPPQQWMILTTDAKRLLESTIASHPRLQSLKRKTAVTIALRTDSSLTTNGFLYAYLPTQQSSGLPLHINADFFPKPDRKAAIFEGDQHQQAWNEGLIHAAANEIASNLEGLRDVLGHENLWGLIEAAAKVSKVDKSTYPDCFNAYWKELQNAFLEKPKIVLTDNESSVAGHEALLSKSPLESNVRAVSATVGITLVSEKLGRFSNWLPAAGVQQLTLERLVSYCEESKYISALPQRTDAQGIHTFFEPLWSLINVHLTSIRSDTAKPLIERLQRLPIGVTNAFQVCTLGECFDNPASIPRKDIEEALPWTVLAHQRLVAFADLKKILPVFTLADAARYLEQEAGTAEKAAMLLGENKTRLRSFYGLLARLDEASAASTETYAQIADLPIWPTGVGFTSACGAMLPGGFTDPVGLATLLSPEVFDLRITEFLKRRLGVRKQSVAAFIEDVLPRFFDDTKRIDDKRYARLITELADHGTILDEENQHLALAKLPLVPTQDGGWNRPSSTYYRTPLLEEVLGELPNLWVDSKRLPNRSSVRNLLTSLGIRTRPAALDLIRQLAHIAEQTKPMLKARESCARTFYAICEQFATWKAGENALELNELEKLRAIACFPADNHEDRWFLPESLYAPYRAGAFESQVKVFALKNMARLNRDLLKMLGIETEPSTQLVVNHLRYCIEKNIPVSDHAYQVLTERAGASDSAVNQLSNDPCVYDESLGQYLTPSRVFWSTQRLGRYAYTAPQHFAQYRAFLDAVGVRTTPSPQQFASILIEITSDHFTSGEPVHGEDLAIYQSCLNGLVADFAETGENALHLNELRESPTILNLQGMPKFPDEMLMLDSEWLRSHFINDLDALLCRPDAQYDSLFAALGVRNLTSLAKIELDFSDGPEKKEESFELLIRERGECILRLVSDKPSLMRKQLESSLGQINVLSFDQVKIRATVGLDGPFVSESKAVDAFYDDSENQLILARPISGRTWPQAFNSILHRFLLDESGSDVARLSAVCWRVVEQKTAQDAHQYLTDIGIPNLLETNEIEAPESPQLDSLGTTEETAKPSFSGTTQSPVATPTSTPTSERPHDQSANPPDPDKSENGEPTPVRPKKRSAFKHKWDQALRSYARPKIEQPRDENTQSESEKRQHDLMVEAASRKIVCDWELKHGRQAEELGLTHPGYDIVSTNPRTGERRLIEVKGIDGGWNRTGVSMSRTQFANAQDFGDKYWLYVVEFALDQDAARVRPIKNPALQVMQFMFDSGWRAVANDDGGDPRDAFIRGAQGDFGTWGKGTIKSVDRKSNGDIRLDIDIDGKGIRHMSLDLHTMRILPREDNHDDDS